MAIVVNNHQITRSTANTNSYTLSSYAVPSGSDRVLVVMLSGLRSNENAINWSAGTFGGTAMTEVAASQGTSSSRRYYAGIWILVNPSGTGNITFTLAGGNLAGAIISAVTLTGVDQTTPVAAYALASVNDEFVDFLDTADGGDVTWNPGYAGDLGVYAVMSNANNNPTWTWDDGELYDLNNGTSSNNEVAGSGAITIAYPVAACSQSPPRTVGVGARFKEATAAVISAGGTTSATSGASSAARIQRGAAGSSSATAVASASPRRVLAAAGTLSATATANASPDLSFMASGEIVATTGALAVPDIPAGPEQTLLNDLEAWWALDETSGTRFDSHGDNDLSDINTVSSTTGKVGNAGLFVNTSAERLERSSAFLNPSAGFTISGWLYKTANSTMIVASSWNEDGVNQRGWRVTSATSTTLRLQTTRNGQFGTALEVIENITNNAWYWFCAWFDPSNNTIAISLNNAAPVTNTQTAVYASPAKFIIGASETSTGGMQHWNGRLDEIAVWSRVLTPDERTWLYNSGNGRGYGDLGGESEVSAEGSAAAASGASAVPSVTVPSSAATGAISAAAAVLSVVKVAEGTSASASNAGATASLSAGASGDLSAASNATASPSTLALAAAAAIAASDAGAVPSVALTLSASLSAASDAGATASVSGYETAAAATAAATGASATPSLLAAVTGASVAVSDAGAVLRRAAAATGSSGALSGIAGHAQMALAATGILSSSTSAAAYPLVEGDIPGRGEIAAVSGAAAQPSLLSPVTGRIEAFSDVAGLLSVGFPASASAQSVTGVVAAPSVERGVAGETSSVSDAAASVALHRIASGEVVSSSDTAAAPSVLWSSSGSISSLATATAILRSLLLSGASSDASSDATAIAVVMAAPLVIYRGVVVGVGKYGGVAGVDTNGAVHGVGKRGTVLSSGDLDYISEV